MTLFIHSHNAVILSDFLASQNRKDLWLIEYLLTVILTVNIFRER